MTAVTDVKLTCDMCGKANDVKTVTFGLDGKAYEIDLCRKDGNALGKIAARYTAKARKVTAATASGTKARATGARKTAKASRPASQHPDGASPTAARAVGEQRTGIYVYGILPADIEVEAGIPGVGEHPGPLRAVRSDGLAALISDVNLSGRLGSPGDQRTHREILDATAAEVPVLPMRFGTILTSEDAVAGELLAARHDEFTAALDQLEGRAEFQVRGRYNKDAVLGEVLSQNKQAARLREAIQGKDPDAARNARTELDQLLNAAVTARREEDLGALRQAMERVCVASVVREPAHEEDAVHAAILAAVDKERDLERALKDLAREWEGRIDVKLLGPTAAYDFTGTGQPES
jgi:hypothetical protein